MKDEASNPIWTLTGLWTQHSLAAIFSCQRRLRVYEHNSSDCRSGPRGYITCELDNHTIATKEKLSCNPRFDALFLCFPVSRMTAGKHAIDRNPTVQNRISLGYLYFSCRIRARPGRAAIRPDFATCQYLPRLEVYSPRRQMAGSSHRGPERILRCSSFDLYSQPVFVLPAGRMRQRHQSGERFQ